jgi:4-hydroxythreonine-4-phosphate dehydrogenase
MENRKIRVGITHGDINGVGYEVILKTFSDPTMLELCTPVVYGSPKVAAYHRKAMEIQTSFSIVNSAEEVQDGRVNVVNCIEEELKVELTKPTPEAGKAALAALERALADYREGLFDVLVTAPINKHTIQSDAFHFPGHTEYIEERVGEGQKALMILLKVDFRSDWGFSNMAINYRPTLDGDSRRALIYQGLKNYAYDNIDGTTDASAAAFADANIDDYAAKPAESS